MNTSTTKTEASESRETSPVRRVSCPRCQAAKNKPCQTGAGSRALSSHVVRWDLAKARFRGEEMVFELRKDDPQFGLNKGDLLLCVDYPLDAKVAVLRRLSDGYNPECNQYIAALRFVAFMTEYEKVPLAN